MSKVLITGCSRGIGYDTALLLARAGHEVVATMRKPGACDLAKVASEQRLPITVLALDVDDDASVAAVFDEHADSIDALVNNAGIYSIDAVEDESIEQMQRVMQTNLFGAIRCVKRVLPAMRRRGSGCIVNDFNLNFGLQLNDSRTARIISAATCPSSWRRLPRCPS